jgi:hypothetical protein
MSTSQANLSASEDATTRPRKWRGSDARVQLELDIIDGHVTADDDPKDVFDMWPDLYHEFALKKFEEYLETLLKKNEKVPDWKKSEAKAQLELDIIAEVVTEGSDPEEVYNMWPVYQKYDKANFKVNLKSLLSRHRNKEELAGFDAKAFTHDRVIQPFPARNGHGELQWHGSRAQEKIQEYIKNGYYIRGTTKPKVLWESDDDYKLFALDTFRDHIYQELKGKKSRNYFKDKARKWKHG